MIRYYLDFEKPLQELHEQIERLQEASSNGNKNYLADIRKLKKKLAKLQQDIFSNLTPWQRTQLARHPDRPYCQDYVRLMLDEFTELHGDRCFADDSSIIGGLGRMGSESLVLIGHQKGRDTKQKLAHNFGMPHPEGYRKALRLMKLAEKFNKPVLTLIDTPGAYPGIGAEERGQAEAIAVNLREMCQLRVPIIAVVTGEGGSGGALALGVGDRILMLQNSIYSVISPESCAAILWRNSSKAREAAEPLKLTAEDAYNLKIIDEIVTEPPGGAHHDHQAMANILRQTVLKNLKQLKRFSVDELLKTRYNKYRQMGQFEE
jgi:acetyl-CoA carboxylase carboxyl transferase subunit alpha